MANEKVLAVRLVGNSKGAVKAIGQTEGKLTGLGKKMLGIGAAVGGIRLGAGLVSDIVATGKAYDSSMNNLQAASQATDAQMKKVSKRAEKLGSDLTLPATSAADAAEAMLQLNKGGLTLTETMDAAKGTLQLAAAAQVSGAEAATIQANAISQFNLKGKDAALVADTLANVANAATGEITDVANALSYVGPVAAGLRIPITDTSTAIGLLAKNGIISEKAGTALRGTLAGLANPSKKAAEALKVLGVEVFDNQGKFKGMRSLTDQLAKAKGRLTDQEFQAAGAAAFGREPLSAINSLAKEGVSGWDDMAKAVGREGAAAELAKAKNKGFGGAIDGLQSQLETLYIKLWKKVSPAMEDVARKTASGLEAFNDFIDGAGDLTGALNNIDGTALGNKMVSIFTSALSRISALSGTLFNKIGAMFAKVDWVTLGIELGKAAVPLVVGLGLGILNFDMVGLLKGLAANWQAVLLGILTIVFMPAKWVAKLAGLLRKIPFVGRFLAWMVTGISKIGKKALKAIWKIPQAFARGFKDAMGWAGPSMLSRLVKFFTSIQGRIAKWALNILRKGRDAMVKFAEGLGRRLASLGPRQVYNALVKVKNKITGFFRSAGSWLLGAGRKIIQGLLDGITRGFGRVRDKLGELTKMLPDWKGPAEKDAKLLTPAGDLIMDGFEKGLASRFDSVRKMLRGFTGDMATAAVPAGAGAPVRGSGSLSGRSARSGFLRGSQGGAAPITVHVTVEGNVTSEKALAKSIAPTIRDEFIKVGKRNGGDIFGKR